LIGPSNPPDPTTHAYRKDLADISLAGRVIASHYAEPLERHITSRTPFRAQPSDDSEALGELSKGDEIRTLDISAGWAWGYAPDGRVGYVRAEAIAG
jgi:hypothetical protein